MKRSLIAITAVLALSACGTLTNEQQGVVLGGLAGGILGNQVGGGSGKAVATIIGAGIGMAVGGNIGRRMDAADQARVQRALETSPSNRTTTWTNPDSRTTYEVTPKPAVQRGNTVCREFTTFATIGTQREQVVGTACRQADGSWKMQ